MNEVSRKNLDWPGNLRRLFTSDKKLFQYTSYACPQSADNKCVEAKVRSMSQRPRVPIGPPLSQCRDGMSYLEVGLVSLQQMMN